MITALAGFGGVAVGSLISWSVQDRLLGRRIAADKSLAKDKFDFDKDLAERKFENVGSWPSKKAADDLALERNPTKLYRSCKRRRSLCVRVV